MSNKIKLAVMFGGRAVEHEISIITAIQLISAIDFNKYDVSPVYIAPNGKWYSGEDLLDKSIYKSFSKNIEKLAEVTLLPKPGEKGLTILSKNSKYKDINYKSGSTLPIDVYFPAFHGEYGEDGCLQGLLEMADVTYVGNGVTAASIAMNKHLCKGVLKSAGIPSLPSCVINKFDFLHNSENNINEILSIEGLSSFPLFVKPCNRGSSVGISKAENEDELLSSLLNVFKYDLQAIIEPFVADMFEINVAVIDDNELIASVVEIPYSDSGILSYEDKYMTGGSKKTSESLGMADLARAIDPDSLSDDIKNQVIGYALKAYKTLNCSGNGRFDFMYNNSNSEIYFNELNPVPGSLAFYLWIKSKPPLLYTEVLDKMINAAIRNKKEKLSLESFIGFKAI